MHFQKKSEKIYREGLPQFNKVQNNTLNQVNIHAQKENDEPQKIECNESVHAGKVAIHEKEGV